MKKFFWLPKQKWGYLYYSFIAYAFYKLSSDAADTFFEVVLVIPITIIIFNFIPYQICRLIIFIFRKKTSHKEKITSGLVIAVIVGFLCLILWSDLSERKKDKNKLSNYGIKYELISEEKLEETCAKADEKWAGECSTTVKKILSSSDGFIFETYTSDGSDSVWCGTWSNNSWRDNKNPCSTVGDYGGGGEDIIVTNKETNKQITVSGNGVQLLRIPTPLDYPNLVFRMYTGGASCCENYILYNKATLAFVSDTKKNKYDQW